MHQSPHRPGVLGGVYVCRWWTATAMQRPGVLKNDADAFDEKKASASGVGGEGRRHARRAPQMVRLPPIAENVSVMRPSVSRGSSANTPV